MDVSRRAFLGECEVVPTGSYQKIRIFFLQDARGLDLAIRKVLLKNKYRSFLLNWNIVALDGF